MAEDSDKQKKLLREIHHRIKNHLQVINSLFELQLMSVNDETANAALQEAAGRLRVVSAIYKNLFADNFYSTVDFGKVVIEIFNQMMNSFTKIDSGIKSVIDIPDLILDPEVALPLGLITNELLTNSLTQQVELQKDRTITLQLENNGDGTLCIKYSDTGIQQPKNFDWNRSDLPLGMRLINGLSKQIGGNAETGNEEWLTFRILFKKN